MVGRSALWRSVRASIRALSLATMCAAAIAAANAQEPGMEVHQTAPENAQPVAKSDKQGSQTSTEPSPSIQQNLQPTPATGEAAQAAPVEVDPIIVLVKHRLTERARGDGLDRADRDALKAFYAEPGRTPMWVADGDLSRRAREVMAEIGRADDWGLSSAAFELPDAKLAHVSQSALADAELKLDLAVLKYARHARGGRVDPMQAGQNSDHKPALIAPKSVLQAIGSAEKPDSYLRGLHPKHPQYLRLRQALIKLRSGRPEAGARAAMPPEGPDLRPGATHPQIAAVRRQLGVRSDPRRDEFYDARLEAAVRTVQLQHQLRPDGVITNSTRAALNGDARNDPILVKAGARGNTSTEIQRIILNMERWRWMPTHLGDLYVWDNIPEYATWIIKRGEPIHSAKIIVGKVDNQTPIFSANMRYVVFHPEWGVPDSIKVQELLPKLRPQQGYGQGPTDIDILRQHNLRVTYEGQPVDASTVNWSQVDVRRFNFIQPPGPKNVLGVVKFRFPNRHDVYMHDTPERFLFDKQARAFSHGCMRVQDPVRFAEFILGEDKGWSSAQVQALLSGPLNNEITLSRQIPVHVTYFTAVADADGKVRFTGDPYGKDALLATALAGRPVNLDIPPEPIETQLSDGRRRRSPGLFEGGFDIFSGLFGN
jgi:L,D-transpeptidase YcbB